MAAQPYGQSFSSPDYPNGYPNDVECVWKIEAFAGHLLTVIVGHCFYIFVHNFLLKSPINN